MNIAIVGAGWIGCHLAKNLKTNHKIKLIDRLGIFSETSFRNQNRLHMGFHYPRSYNTRKLCYNTFDKFCDEYNDILLNVENNIYTIPKDKSIIDFETYKAIMKYENLQFNNYNLEKIINIEGSISCKEKHIDHQKAKTFFEKELKDVIEISELKYDDILKLSSQFDIVINCTNNSIKDNYQKSYYELCLVLLYKKNNITEFDALTLMDGQFFSIYPYQNNIYTITDVQYTPLYKSEDIISNYFINIEELIPKVENKIKYFYPDFNTDFAYVNYYTSIKVKKYNESADRYPVINKEKNIINCYTGKIQGIYMIEDFINENINR